MLSSYRPPPPATHPRLTRLPDAVARWQGDTRKLSKSIFENKSCFLSVITKVKVRSKVKAVTFHQMDYRDGTDDSYEAKFC